MPEFAALLTRSASAGRRFTELFKGSRALLRSGVVSYIHPAENVKYVRATSRYGALVATCQHAARSTPARSALIDDHGVLTFAELDRQSNALARGLHADGVRASDAVAVLARDLRGIVLAMLAAGKLGIHLLRVDSTIKAGELDEFCTAAGVHALLHDAEFTGLAATLSDRVPRYLTWSDEESLEPFRPTLRALIGAHSQAPLRSLARVGTLLGSSAATSSEVPRERQSALASAQFLDRIPLHAGQIIVLAGDWDHSTTLALLSLAFALGSTVVSQQWFDAERTVRFVEMHRADVLAATPEALREILDLGAERVRKYDHSSLSVIIGTGAPLTEDLCRRAEEVFGPVLHTVYSPTPGAVAAVATPDELRLAPGTVGRSPFTCRVALFTADGERIAAPHTPGRVFVAYAQGIEGRQPEHAAGMIATADTGHFDESGLYFIDRNGG
ncbi:AMP-binding protein [Hoyosella sp. YIM 151337]|uniref:AMP-binding protein n=1 Tax=Hoyosella sp. YIM 151337 TaxID=2992742 RepID=UPI002235CF16|nr:AMP-binding protein [Hoyosella sp. YIM 151337]MCW4352246.1 AMP-binding protein [Hoyosella sp. YIM 151337]